MTALGWAAFAVLAAVNVAWAVRRRRAAKRQGIEVPAVVLAEVAVPGRHHCRDDDTVILSRVALDDLRAMIGNTK